MCSGNIVHQLHSKGCNVLKKVCEKGTLFFKSKVYERGSFSGKMVYEIIKG